MTATDDEEQVARARVTLRVLAGWRHLQVIA